eukprot:CAMPEP_0174257502 /NCGR_PEP_ID=MMETSP0439-20130205/6622_1 /TAXON_ID=0 /ORGANISM="Stereomyxa ramosa, Strain Chinc5" /LENGTH=510 /DNA_ID=CAMNT_0015340603 /DNA_START=254 /DNA_END=1786 /DNA_ORIENTATION=-
MYKQMEEESIPNGKNIEELINLVRSRTFKDGKDVTQVTSNGHVITKDWFETGCFNRPTLILDKAGLGLRVPEKSFDVDEVARLVGNRPLDVIDVRTQEEVLGWTMGDWADYYGSTTRTELLNVISLEFSDTKLKERVASPKLVREVDWIDLAWPTDLKASTQETQDGEAIKISFLYPKVQNYCLMSVGGCFTDFHIDFAGSSVWYHVLRGQKEFFLIRPTEENLRAYERWLTSPVQDTQFFGDFVDSCYKLTINPGNTLLIPSCWIHAVYTPVDSLVFGGNFLHGMSMVDQFKIYQLENRVKINPKFMFPYFEELMWYAMRYYHYQYTDKRIDEHLGEGLRVLIPHLRKWLRSKKHRPHVPNGVQAENILDDLEAMLKAQGWKVRGYDDEDDSDNANLFSDDTLDSQTQPQQERLPTIKIKSYPPSQPNQLPFYRLSTDGHEQPEVRLLAPKKRKRGRPRESPKDETTTQRAASPEVPVTPTKRKPSTTRQRLIKKLGLNRKYGSAKFRK